MKRIYTILVAILLTATVFAQAPEKMSYQAVIRNSSDSLVTNTQVGMQISILQNSASGTAVYVETQAPTTNANGLVSIEIGNGTVVSGDFATINWINGPYFIKTETDLNGGANYTITGTSQLLSVAYALHAKTADSLIGGVTETDPVFGVSVASGITGTDTTNWNNKLDSEVDSSITNEIQTINISNDTIYLTNGGFAKLPEPVFTSPNGDQYKYYTDNCGNMIKKKINSTSQEKIIERAEFIYNTLEDTKYVHSADSIMDECQGIYYYDCSGLICEFIIRECLPNHYQDLYNYYASIGGSTRPLAKDFYDYFRDTILGSSYDPNIAATCTAENQYWKVFTNVDSLQKGDIVVARYSDAWCSAEGNATTGHVMIAWSGAFPTGTANEYDIKIFDAAGSGHSADSRESAPPVSRDSSGVGQGWMKYKSSTLPSNRPIQYLWKLTSSEWYRSFSTYYDPGHTEDERKHECLEGIIFARPID